MRRMIVLLLILSLALSGCTEVSTSGSAGAPDDGQAHQSSDGSSTSAGQGASDSPPESGAPTDNEQPADSVTSAPPAEESDSIPPADPGAPADEVVPSVPGGDSGERGEQTYEAGDSQFLDAVGTAWRGDVPDESTVLQIGRNACEQIKSGVQISDVNVVEGNGDVRDQNNDVSRLAALHLLCPESIRFE